MGAGRRQINAPQLHAAFHARASIAQGAPDLARRLAPSRIRSMPTLPA
jgi:hypothetical protein